MARWRFVVGSALGCTLYVYPSLLTVHVKQNMQQIALRSFSEKVEQYALLSVWGVHNIFLFSFFYNICHVIERRG